MLEANTHSQTLLVLSVMFWDPLCKNLAVLQMFMKNSVNSSLALDRLSAISRVVIRQFYLTKEFTAAIDS